MVEHLAILASARNEFPMCPGLHDLPMIENEDLIGALNGRQPVGDDQQGAVPPEPVDGGLNGVFGHAVELARRLIENKDLGV